MMTHLLDLVMAVRHRFVAVAAVAGQAHFLTLVGKVTS
jgi:hypothetical protein